MKHNLFVHQKAVHEAGLIGRVKIEDGCLLSYLHGWHVHPKANRVTVEGRKFVWLAYGNAVDELPMLFNPEAGLASRKNQLARQMQKLRVQGLIETTRVAGRLYFRLSDLGQRLAYSGKKAPAAAKGSVTTQRENSVTPPHDGCVSREHDEPSPTIIDEPSGREYKINEPPPQSPLEGEGGEVIALWNSFPTLPSTKTLTTARAKKLRACLAGPFWRANWREAIQKIADNPFLTGGGENGWRADFDWFLRPDSLVKVLEGKYNARPLRPTRLSVIESNIRLKAIEQLMKAHPGKDEDHCDDGDERDQYSKLEAERRGILEQLASPTDE